MAGFGNMAAGVALHKVASWSAFKEVPTFFVLLPSFVGLKGNIEMTLASRLSTLANLNLLATNYQRKHAYASNLILILSQAIGLSLLATIVAVFCELVLGGGDTSKQFWLNSILVVLPAALLTAVVLVVLSSFVISLSILIANLIQVNPDNLSTLIAALYGDVSCLLTYGLIADWMHQNRLARADLTWPIAIISLALASFPIFCYMAYKFKETHSIALSSIPPMLAAILVSMGSGAILSLYVSRFNLIALYQPIVNGFGANLVAVQSSRVSTWLWCTTLRKLSVVSGKGDLAEFDSFGEQQFCDEKGGKPFKGSLETFLTSSTISIGGDKSTAGEKQRTGPNLVAIVKSLCKTLRTTLLWSFFNPSPNSTAARLLMAMIVPAHTLYFLVIWLLSQPANYVVLTWQFYLVYMLLCLVQVFILLTICEPLMTLLMSFQYDPDVFGISLLMALADLLGTLCLTAAFLLLAGIGDVNATH